MANAQVVSGFVPMNVPEAFANQVAFCRANGSSITARVVAAIAAQLDAKEPGTFITRIRDWPGAPMLDALPLRSAGALHALHLAGGEPELAALYRGDPGEDAAIIGRVVRDHAAFLLPWLDGPPQTNEAGRSAGFMAALLWLAERGLPPRFECLEIGSSAGINLMIDRYRYDLGGVTVGPEDAAMRFAPEWRGPPPPDRQISFAALKGCDVAPLDLGSAADALRLRSYIWPEQPHRIARLEAAIAAAHDRPPDLVRMNAADFIERQLARPQASGTTRVLMHSVVWQYVPADQHERIDAAMAAAGARASAERPLAWVALEANRTLLNHALTVRCWPDGVAGQEHILAAAHAHGAWLEWLIPPAPKP